MANIKHIRASGWVPFDLVFDDSEETAIISKHFALCSFPSWGLRVEVHTGDGNEKWVPNEHGGKTHMNYFSYYGAEAVWTDWLLRFRDAVFRRGGTFDEFLVQDIEDFCAPEDLLTQYEYPYKD